MRNSATVEEFRPKINLFALFACSSFNRKRNAPKVLKIGKRLFSKLNINISSN